MPDWFYRTVTRPLFFKMPAVQAHDFALRFMGRLPLGPAAIDFLGHMRADPGSGSSSWASISPPPSGSDSGSMPKLGLAGTRPVWLRIPGGRADDPEVGERQRADRTRGGAASHLVSRSPGEPGPSRGGAPSRGSIPHGLPLIVRVRDAEVIREFAPYVQLFAMDTFANLAEVLEASPKPVLLCIQPARPVAPGPLSGRKPWARARARPAGSSKSNSCPASDLPRLH